MGRQIESLEGRRARLRAAALATVGGSLAVVIFGFLGAGHGNGNPAPSTAARATPARPRGATPPASPRLTRLADRIAAAWPSRQGEAGLFVEPLTGASRHGYGQAMLAETLMRSGQRRGDRRMVHAGVRALAASAGRAADEPLPGNPLELLGVASAHRWAQRHLRDDPVWRRRAGASRRYLRNWRSAEVGPAAQRCFAAPGCWDNYKIVQATAVLELLATRLGPGSPAALLSDPGAARAAALATIGRDLPRAIGHHASAAGVHGTRRGLGVLSDEPTYPLAYHALSMAALARGLDLLGPRAPSRATRAFRRGMLAAAAFAGPDGDVAYLGRAQGESWALAATAYASESCAQRFRISAPHTAAICAGLGARVLRRLRSVHGFRHGLLAIVPRFRRAAPTRAGLEHYARVASFTGLTGLFLGWAAAAARGAGVQDAPLPLDAGGAFADRDRTRLAIVRRGPLWFAVHGIGSRVDDVRYEFGLTAFKLRAGRRWRDVLPQRPFVEGAGALDGCGPVLMTPSGPAQPWGERFSIARGTGEVTVHGGFRTAGGAWALRGAVFRYRPHGDAVTLDVSVPPGSLLRFQDYVPGPHTLSAGGRVLRWRGATARLSPRPDRTEPGEVHASSYEPALEGVVRYVIAPATGAVRWRLAANTAR